MDGTIALDLQFVEALLDMLGPITVQEYGITVTVDTLSEVTLEQTRDERTVPGAPGKSMSRMIRSGFSRSMRANP